MFPYDHYCLPHTKVQNYTTTYIRKKPMSIDKLRKSIKEQIQKEETNKLDTKRNIDEYNYNLEKLYTTIKKALDSLIEEKLCGISEKIFQIDEELLGRYDAKGLSIEMGGKIISVEPYATMLIGSKGRVDIKSKSKMKSCLLLKKSPTENEWVWCYNTAHTSSRPTYTIVNDSVITDILADMIND
jgi:hypothetical protein